MGKNHHSSPRRMSWRGSELWNSKAGWVPQSGKFTFCWNTACMSEAKKVEQAELDLQLQSNILPSQPHNNIVGMQIPGHCTRTHLHRHMHTERNTYFGTRLFSIMYNLLFNHSFFIRCFHMLLRRRGRYGLLLEDSCRTKFLNATQGNK